MIIKKCEDAVREFLKKYPNPRVTYASTIKEGYVTCIKPIPTICGAELICSENTKHDVLKLVRQAQIGNKR